MMLTIMMLIAVIAMMMLVIIINYHEADNDGYDCNDGGMIALIYSDSTVFNSNDDVGNNNKLL